MQQEEIRSQKRKLGNLVIDEQAKRLKVEQKREEVLKKGEKTKKFYLKKFRVLARKVAYLQEGKGGPEKKKTFTDYSQRHKVRIRQQMKDTSHATLSFLGLYDLISTKVEVFNTETQQYETFSLVDHDELLKETDSKELTDRQRPR